MVRLCKRNIFSTLFFRITAKEDPEPVYYETDGAVICNNLKAQLHVNKDIHSKNRIAYLVPGRCVRWYYNNTLQ